MSGARGQESSKKKRPMEQPSVPDTIKLKIKGQDGVEVFFQIPRCLPLMKLLKSYCQKRNLEYTSMEFIYEGYRVPVKRSAADLNMEDGDEIEAMMHQSGGGCKCP